MSINRVVLTGRITKDIELRATQSDNKVTSFSIAVDSYSKNQETNTTTTQTSFINCVAWNNQANFLNEYCKKGSLIAIEGRIQSRSYDRRDGTKAYVTEVVVDRVENLTPSPKENADANVNNSPVQQEPKLDSSFSIDDSGNENDDSLDY